MKTAQELLRQVYTEHRTELPPVYKWASEKARLNEFYYCLLQRISGKNEVDVQNIVTSLASLNLLDIETLATAKVVGGPGGRGDKLAALINDILLQNGFDEIKAKDCTLAFCEAAKGIRANGKLQFIMRKFGNQIIDELAKNIPFSKIPEQEKRLFLSHWMQNAFEFPVPLSNEYVDRFCKQNSISVESLVKATDELDISAAVVDDLVKLHMLKQEVPKVSKAVSG